MPLYTRKPAQIPQSQIEGLARDDEVFSASTEEAIATGPASGLWTSAKLWATENVGLDAPLFEGFGPVANNPLSGFGAKAPELTPDEATQRVKDAGLEGQIPLSQYPNGIRSTTLQTMIDANTAKVRRQATMQQADGWAPQLGGMLLGSLVDPINVASAFIPVVGEARYAKLIANAGGAFGRTTVRAGVGALEGAVGAAVVEPLVYAGQQQWRNDYSAYDSLLNVAGGAIFGSFLHAGAGLVKDAFGRPVEVPTPDRVAPEQVTPEQLASVEVEPVRVEAPEVAVPNEFIARTKGGEWRLTDMEAVQGRDFSEFGQIREVVAYDGDTPIGSLIYANDGTPPTIEVSPAYQRKGVATAMLKLAKERGGVLGDARTGVSGRERPTYRTDEGQAFRTAADESTVELRPRMERAEVPQSSADPFAPIRPMIAKLEPQTQAQALRNAISQDAQGNPIDVTPAMLTDPNLATPESYRTAVDRAAANSGLVASAEPHASVNASQKLAQTPQKASPLEQAKQALADDEARYRESGGDPADIEAGEDMKVVNDAVKAATLCMMRSGA